MNLFGPLTVDAIVAPLGTIIRRLEAHAETHAQLVADHVARIADLHSAKDRAAMEAEKAKAVAAKIAALIA